MNEYKVIWEIEVEAETPEEAARMARDHQEPGTSALTFDVLDEEGEYTTINLGEQ